VLAIQARIRRAFDMKFPFDDLNMRDAEHVEWVKSQRDPELWHAAAMVVVNYLGDPCGFLVWLADQPETDRATAGYVFLAYGSSYLRGQTDFSGGEGLSGEEWLNALNAICRRAATIGFTNDSLGLHPGSEAERQACLDLIKRGRVADGIPVPHALLDAPFPPERKLRYFVEDGSVLDFNPGPFLAPKKTFCPRCQRTGWVCKVHRHNPIGHALPDGSKCGGAAAPCEEPDCPYRTHPTDAEVSATESEE
jgi:hypothetical protein